MADREVTIHGFSFSGMDSSKLSDAPTSLYFYNLKEGMKRATIYEFEITNQTMDKFSITFAKPITIRPGELYISSEMSIVSFKTLKQIALKYIHLNLSLSICLNFKF